MNPPSEPTDPEAYVEFTVQSPRKPNRAERRRLEKRLPKPIRRQVRMARAVKAEARRRVGQGRA